MRLDVGRAVSRSVGLYFKLFGVLFLAALIVNAVVQALVGGVVLRRNQDFGELIVGIVVLVVAAMVASALVQALSTHAVGDMEAGERTLTMGQLFAMAGPVVGAVIGVSLLQGIGVAFGLLALVVPGVLAITWWSVAVPAAVVERPGVIAAFGRSIQLVRGNAWAVLGYGLVMVLITVAGGFVVDLVLLRLVDLDNILGAAVATILADSVLTPFIAVGYAVLYFELRRIEDDASPGPETATWE